MVVETINNNVKAQQITRALNHYKNMGKFYSLFENYYDGNHKLNFATDKMNNAFGHLFKAFADNLCPTIVDAEVDRLSVSGFQGSDSQTAWELWKRDRLDGMAYAVHQEALKLGDAFVLVWPSKTGPTITAQPTNTMFVHYNDDVVPDYATKLWQTEDKQWRLNLYTQESIEKYITTSTNPNFPEKATAFRRFLVPGEAWPLRTPTELQGRIPIFHFANNAGMQLYGRSELANAIPLQDALNKSISDMLVAMEFVALPQRWATGLEIDVDPTTGQPKIPFKAGVDRIWSSPDPDTKFGQFDAADLQRFTVVQNDFRAEMARITNTPMHYLSLSNSGAQNPFVASAPTGEAQKTAEAPFIAKVKKAQTTFGDVWEDIFTMRLRIEGNSNVGDLETIWNSAESHSKVDDANIAVQKVTSLGVPKEQVWKELGYTDEQITQMKAMAETESEQTTSQFLDVMARR